MQKAKKERQVQRQEDMEKVYGHLQKMHTRYCTIGYMWCREPLKVLNNSKSILNQPQKINKNFCALSPRSAGQYS